MTRNSTPNAQSSLIKLSRRERHLSGFAIPATEQPFPSHFGRNKIDVIYTLLRHHHNNHHSTMTLPNNERPHLPPYSRPSGALSRNHHVDYYLLARSFPSLLCFEITLNSGIKLKAREPTNKDVLRWQYECGHTAPEISAKSSLWSLRHVVCKVKIIEGDESRGVIAGCLLDERRASGKTEENENIKASKRKTTSSRNLLSDIALSSTKLLCFY